MYAYCLPVHLLHILASLVQLHKTCLDSCFANHANNSLLCDRLEKKRYSVSDCFKVLLFCSLSHGHSRKWQVSRIIYPSVRLVSITPHTFNILGTTLQLLWYRSVDDHNYDMFIVTFFSSNHGYLYAPCQRPYSYDLSR